MTPWTVAAVYFTGFAVASAVIGVIVPRRDWESAAGLAAFWPLFAVLAPVAALFYGCARLGQWFIRKVEESRS